MKILSDSENVLLHRREIVAHYSSESNPGFGKVSDEVAQNFKAGKDCVVVKGVESGFGSGQFKVTAYIYKDAESLKAIEPKKKEKKVKGS